MLQAWKDLRCCLCPWHRDGFALQHGAVGIGAALHAVRSMGGTGDDRCLGLWLGHCGHLHRLPHWLPITSHPAVHSAAAAAAPLIKMLVPNAAAERQTCTKSGCCLQLLSDGLQSWSQLSWERGQLLLMLLSLWVGLKNMYWPRMTYGGQACYALFLGTMSTSS